MHVYARLCVASSTNHLLLPSPCSDQHAAAAATISFRCMRGKLELHEGVCVCRACKRKSLMQHCIRLCVCVCVRMCVQLSCEKCAKFMRFSCKNRVYTIFARFSHKNCTFFVQKNAEILRVFRAKTRKLYTIFARKLRKLCAFFARKLQ